MAAIGKIEKEIKIQTPAEKLYKIFKSQCHHIPNMSKDIHTIDVHEGDWEKEGSEKHWKYSLGTYYLPHTRARTKTTYARKFVIILFPLFFGW